MSRRRPPSDVTPAVAGLARNAKGMLFDPGPRPPRPPWFGGTALMCVPHGPCPRCSFPTAERVSIQAPLFWHGGFGEARRDSISFCCCCGWFGWFARRSINPRRVATAI